MSYEMIVGLFPGDVEKGPEQLKRYEEVEDQLSISEALAIVRTEDGKDELNYLGERRKKARRVGAVAGALLGVLGGPATMVVLGLGGAAAGNLVAKLTQAGVSKEIIEKVENSLEPGSSAVVLIVEQEKSHLILRDLKETGAVIANQSVASQVIEGKYLIQPSSGISETQ